MAISSLTTDAGAAFIQSIGQGVRDANSLPDFGRLPELSSSAARFDNKLAQATGATVIDAGINPVREAFANVRLTNINANAGATAAPVPPISSEPAFAVVRDPSVTDTLKAIDSGRIQGLSANVTPEQVNNTNLVERQRALQGLDLDAKAVDARFSTTGDTILDGLQGIRSEFEKQEGRISALSEAGVTDTGRMLAMQVEVVKYALMIDVTSKLTGKTTQAFDTLLKGQ